MTNCFNSYVGFRGEVVFSFFLYRYDGHPIKNETFSIEHLIYTLGLCNLVQSKRIFLAVHIHHIRRVT